MNSLTKSDLYAYLRLMRGDDGGRGFLQVTRHAQGTPEKEALRRSTLRDAP